MDSLNSDLKNISSSFVKNNENEINQTKDNLQGLISELLEDFSSRINGLETEVKKDLDEHVDRHKTIAGELKPKMELILEKYLDRMDKIIKELKEKIDTLLGRHIEHLRNTTEVMQEDLKKTFDNKHSEVRKQTTEFKDRTVQLIDNLLEISDRFTDLSDDLASRGTAFKALLFGQHKKYKARYAQVKEDILTYSKPLKEDFISESEGFIETDDSTTEEVKSELTEIISKENTKLSGETTDLNQEAQQKVDAQLENLATDLNTEIDETLQSGIDDCADTTVKLKDSVEKSFKEHNDKYDESITRHKDESLRHYTEFDTEIKRKNENWVKDVDYKFNDSKRNVSDKINGHITEWDNESAELNSNLSNMLEDHKTKYKENATELQNSLSNTTKENTQNTKDAIADFTLEFMNSIDDATEKAETNEEKLMDIFQASKAIPEIAKITTWHTVGREALVSAIKDAVYRTKSSIIIVTPIPVPEVLQVISEYAFQKKAARFMLTSNFDMDQYGNIIGKMKQLGNIQFRQLAQAGDYYAVTRDAEEVIICPNTDKETEMISIISNQDQYAKLYSQFVGPIFQANSRPIK
jgi:molecular chaperone GrpE (heat shock protein)